MTTAEANAEFVAEVLRMNDRFTLEIVERFNLCPYARAARLCGKSYREVLLQRDLRIEPTLEVIARLERDPDPADVVQLIYPCLVSSAREFDGFSAQVRNARAASAPARPVYVHAVFHPDHPYDPRTPDSLVPFFRRTPDPTIQLVRPATEQSMHAQDTLDVAVAEAERFLRGEPLRQPLVTPSQRITQDNFAMILREGPEALEAIHQAIRQDRARSYARFG
jgi:hypothetical protein